MKAVLWDADLPGGRLDGRVRIEGDRLIFETEASDAEPGQRRVWSSHQVVARAGGVDPGQVFLSVPGRAGEELALLDADAVAGSPLAAWPPVRAALDTRRRSRRRFWLGTGCGGLAVALALAAILALLAFAWRWLVPLLFGAG